MQYAPSTIDGYLSLNYFQATQPTLADGQTIWRERLSRRSYPATGHFRVCLSKEYRDKSSPEQRFSTRHNMQLFNESELASTLQ